MALAYLAALCLSQGGAPASKTIQELDDYLTQASKSGFSGVVLLQRGDETLLHKAYGVRDREAERPMTTGTGFDVGSLVKPWTAAAIFKLEAQGKLSTSDTLQKHFANVPEDKKDITLDMVLTHKAGFPDVFGGDYELVERDDLMQKLFAAPLIAKPGERAEYSNVGYSLLATVIEKVSGEPYEEFVWRQILHPAGGDKVGYKLAHWSNEDLAVGYGPAGRRWGSPLDHAWMDDGPSWNLRGNGGMLASAEDILKVFRALEEGGVLPESAKAKYMARYYRKLPSGQIATGLAGGNGFFNSIYYAFPEQGIRFVGLSNFGGQQIEDHGKAIREVLMKSWNLG